MLTEVYTDGQTAVVIEQTERHVFIVSLIFADGTEFRSRAYGYYSEAVNHMLGMFF